MRRQRLANQLRRPSGLSGLLIGRKLARWNAVENALALELVEVRAGDTVLEVGFGPGEAIHALAEAGAAARVLGVDHSHTMLAQARRRNAKAIRAGRVELLQAGADRLPFEDETVDRMLAVNVVYFLDDAVAAFREWRRVLRPGGRLAIFLTHRDDMTGPLFDQTGVFNRSTGDETVERLTAAGFAHARFETRDIDGKRGICVVAER
jgi:ubiquinone/menaquinone biosynthesis C-methylase UbiE